MKHRIPTAKELNTLMYRNHRETHFNKMTEKKSNPEVIEFAEKVRKTLNIIHSRMKSAVIYSKRNYIYYHFYDEKVCKAVLKAFTKKGYTIAEQSTPLMFKISW